MGASDRRRDSAGARELVVTVAHHWARRERLALTRFERPDESEHEVPAVDLLARDAADSPLLVLEHTLVESFVNQRSHQIAAVGMFESIVEELDGQLPSQGAFVLAVAAADTLGLGRRAARIRNWAKAWVVDTAPGLALAGGWGGRGTFATSRAPGTSLSIRLQRIRGEGGRLHLWFDAPSESKALLAGSLVKATSKKQPKLHRAKLANPGAASLLLLELADIALGNPFDLDTIVQDQLAVRDGEVPDHIWIVDTADLPPNVLISKDRERLGNAVRDRFFSSRS